MDFSWPKKHIKFKEEVIQFARAELNASVRERDNAERFPLLLWKKCAEFGILGLSLPNEFGGSLTEDNFLRSILAMEGFGYACQDNGLAFGLNAQMWTVQTPILHFGSEAQKKKYLSAMSKGTLIGCHALTEPNAGSDVFSMQTTAKKVEGGYLLNGKKHLITLAPVSDVALVFANTNPKAANWWSVTAFLIEKGTKGFRSSAKKSKMGMRSIPIGDLEFEDCFIPEENRLGAEGSGYSIVNHSLEYDRCCILASQLGTMERQLEDAIAYANNREQFAQKIGQFQSVSNRIADMKLRHETARLLLYKTAWLKQNGENASLESAMLKLHLSESFLQSSMDTIRTFGGMAYLTENEKERDLRDAVGSVLYAGTSDIQRNIISKLLGL